MNFIVGSKILECCFCSILSLEIKETVKKSKWYLFIADWTVLMKIPKTDLTIGQIYHQ